MTVVVPEPTIAACCAASYSHPAARWLLGDSFHPGGLVLTSHVARLIGLGPTSRILDAGSGRGATAVHLAKTLGCQVVGVTLEEEGVVAGQYLARREGVEDRVVFLQGDIQEAELEEESFDAVLMECVLSILPDKEGALRRLWGLLRPGGQLGLTDVTVSGALPLALQGILAVAGCVGDARSLQEYHALLGGQGFVVDLSQDLPETVATFLQDVRGKLLLAEVASKLGKLPIGGDVLAEGKRILAEVQGLVLHGVLGYGLVVARKP